MRGQVNLSWLSPSNVFYQDRRGGEEERRFNISNPRTTHSLEGLPGVESGTDLSALLHRKYSHLSVSPVSLIEMDHIQTDRDTVTQLLLLF